MAEESTNLVTNEKKGLKWRIQEWREERLNFVERKREAKFKWLEKKAGLPHHKEFFLVFWMLVSLTLLVLLIAFFPTLMKFVFDNKDFTNNISPILDYSKWVLSALLAAFGAWIGAGAAYFFGKENLRESSRATEEALRIQQQTLGTRTQERTYVKDIPLTAVNSSFLFKADDPLENLIGALKDKLGYWFIPIIESESGILKDVIATQILWKYEADSQEAVKDKKVKDLVEFLEKQDEFKKYHGADVFFIKIKLSDTLQDVADRMKSPCTAVAIVVDAKGKPTHCVTRTDLGTLLKPAG